MYRISGKMSCLLAPLGSELMSTIKDDDLLVVENHRSAGDAHWLMMPRSTHHRHIRDIEALTERDIPLCKYSAMRRKHIELTGDAIGVEAMDGLKKDLLRQHYPNVKPGDVLSGYHRGRRTLFGRIVLPDIISVHHLHLHVIVRPRPIARFFKYPFWLSFMWMSDRSLLHRLQGRAVPR